MVPFTVCVRLEFAPHTHTHTHNIVSFAVALFFLFSNKIRFYMNGTETFLSVFMVQRTEAHRSLLGGGVTWLYELG